MANCTGHATPISPNLMTSRHSPPSPWSYVITLYLPFGILTGLMTGFPVGLFKLLAFPNETIGMLNGIGMVAAFRFLYAPWLDGAATKRGLSLLTLCVAGIAMLAISGIIWIQPGRDVFLWSMVAALLGLAIVSAAHETAADGYYIRALDAKLQAQFIGIKTASIRIGGLSVIMVLLLGATKIAALYGATGVDSPDKTGFHVGFAAAYAFAAAIMFGFFVWNKFMIPVIPEDQRVRHARNAFLEVTREYFQQPAAFKLVFFILLYRFGEGFLLAMRGPFILDPVAKGGLGAEASAVAYYAILTDMPWMILGGVLGGYIIKWFGLRRTIVPLALLMSLPNLLYVLMAWFQPMAHISLLGENLNIALLIVESICSLSYGLSFSAMFYYMHIMATESGRNKTSILAISFAFMNIGFFLPAMMSGFVQSAIGYTGVFVLSVALGLLVLLVIPLLPMPQAEQKSMPGEGK